VVWSWKFNSQITARRTVYFAGALLELISKAARRKIVLLKLPGANFLMRVEFQKGIIVRLGRPLLLFNPLGDFEKC
jgi:hypothetical protein